MRKKQNHDPMPTPPFICFLECGRVLQSKFSREAEHWDWFRGYGEKTIHVCPDCIKYQTGKYSMLKNIVNMKPHNYPHTQVKVTTAKEMLS